VKPYAEARESALVTQSSSVVFATGAVVVVVVVVVVATIVVVAAAVVVAIVVGAAVDKTVVLVAGVDAAFVSFPSLIESSSQSSSGSPSLATNDDLAGGRTSSE